MTAQILRPLRCASESRSRTSMPTPSEKPVPSAASANALHRPSADRPPWRANSRSTCGIAMTVTPPASARPHSPWRSDCTAWCTVTSEDEHAVSVDTAGPSRPSAYDTRPDATLSREPICA